MSDPSSRDPDDKRESFIVDCLVDAFSDLMAADPDAFRTKFRKMATDPFAFYRGSACVFYADIADRDDRWADDRTSRVWIQGDLHAENFGTYMDGSGKLIFDVNDFDEAFVGHFTWDLNRFAASIALMCWQKALSDEEITALIDSFVRAYVTQARWFVDVDDDSSFSLNLDTARGAVLSALQSARLSTRAQMLDRMTRIDDWDRGFATFRACAALTTQSGALSSTRSRATWRQSRRRNASGESLTTSRMSSASPEWASEVPDCPRTRC